MIKEVDDLIQRGKFHEGLVLENPQWIGQVLSTSNLSGDAAKACLEEILQCLMVDEITKIGVWGMGGVGKTSIMKVINNKLLNETEKFDIVIWITVSKEMSIAKLQEDIASKVGVTFSGVEDEITKAGKLFEALSRKSRFVMILDDIWEKVSLETIGILEPSNGSKLVLSTISFDVCRQLGCKVIKVKPLEESEAWHLFSEKVGRDILHNPELEPIAKSIAKRCAGLPLGVLTVAACMKGIDDLSEWRNALKELTSRKKSVNGLEDEVFQQLRFSYDRLKDVKLQHCFLSCALYPEDFEIKERDLVQLWIAEGLVEEMDSRQAEFDRGHAIMNRLINNCLLEVLTREENGRRVKMHDLVREMALHITNEKPRFLVKAGMRLTKPPDVQEWSKDLEKVSLMWSLELCVLYPMEMSPPKCPMLTTLLLSECDIESIPEGFFKHMGQVKILDLSQNPIRRLPESISNLENLTALLLAWCEYLKRVPSLSKLCRLKKLDLEGIKIEEVPHGMQNLTSLKYLEMELYDLHNLNLCVQALHGSEELHEYVIRVGDRDWSRATQTIKCIELLRCDDIYTNQIILPRGIEELYVDKCDLYCSEEYPLFSRFIQVSLDTFSSLKFLELCECRNMKKLFSPNYLPLNLEHLEIVDCDELEEIIASFESDERGPIFCLPHLRRMDLCGLPKLKSISKDGAMVCDSLGDIEVVNCSNMKNLFFPYYLPLNLEHLKVTHCWELEEIIASGVEPDERGTVFNLPQLRSMVLGDLPKLKSICSMDGVMVCDSLRQIVVSNCRKLKRMPLDLPQLDNIRFRPSVSLFLHIRPKEWWESVEWDHPDAKSLFKVQDGEGSLVTYFLEARSS